MEFFLPAHASAISGTQAGKDRRRQNRQRAQGHQRFVDTADHRFRTGMKLSGDEERRCQTSRRNAKADRQLLPGACDRAAIAGLGLGQVSVNERIHAGVLQ